MRGIAMVAGAVALALTLPAAGAAASDTKKAKTCAGADTAVSEQTPAQLASAVRCLVNQERTSRGLSKLRWSSLLRQAAARHNTDMVSNQYFSHTGRNGSTVMQRLRRAGYRPKRFAENIGWGMGTAATPAARVKRWMASGGQHRRNILDRRLREFGVSAVLGAPVDSSDGAEVATYVICFGTR